MQEVFYEETLEDHNPKKARKKYLTCKIFGIIFYCLAAVFLFLSFFYNLQDPVDNTKIRWDYLIIWCIVPMVVFLLLGIYCGRLRFRYCISYDYTFVSGSIRISKVMNGMKRKLMLRFDCGDIFLLGKYGSDTFAKTIADKNIKKIFATPNREAEEGKEFFYLGVNHDGTKKVVILECTEVFMVNVLKFSNKSIVEKDFK